MIRILSIGQGIYMSTVFGKLRLISINQMGVLTQGKVQKRC